MQGDEKTKIGFYLTKLKTHHRLILLSLIISSVFFVSCGGSDDYTVETSTAQHTVMFDGGNHTDISLYLEGKDNVLQGETAIIEIKRQLDARIAECPPALQAVAKDIAFVIVNDFCFKWDSGVNSGLAVGAYYPSMGMIKVSLYSGWQGDEYPNHNHAPHTLRNKDQMVAWSGGDTQYQASNYYSGKTYPADGRFPMGKLLMVVEHELKHVIEYDFHAKMESTFETDEVSPKMDIAETKGKAYDTQRVYDEKEGAWGYFHLPVDM